MATHNATTEFITIQQYSPTISVSQTATGGLTFSLTGQLDMDGAGNFTEDWAVEGTLPVIEMVGVIPPSWSLIKDLFPIQLNASLANSNWRMRGELPIVEMLAEVIDQIDWRFEGVLPVVQVAGQFYALDVESRTAFSLNPVTQAHADYSNFGFDGFCEFNGQYIGCNETGLFTLAGDDDAGTPIDASFRFGTVDEGTPKLKRVDSAYLNLRHDGELNILMKYDEMDEDISLIDHNASIDPEGIHTRRAKFSRGVRGRNLQVGVENVSGADFEITDLEVITVPLSRT